MVATRLAPVLSQELAERERRGEPIRVGVIGAGVFGTQIIAQTSRAAGLTVAAIADLEPERAVRALRIGGVVEDEMSHAATAAEIDSAIGAGRHAVTRSVDELLASGVEVVIEVTGSPEVAAGHALAAIEARKHLVLVTVEADVVVGPLLKRLADEAGVHYSMALGDEPALAWELVDWARSCGFRVIAAGKGTRFVPEFRRATPDNVGELYGFTGKDYNPYVFCSFLDGSKHSIEMAALANAAGLSVDVRGMHFGAIDLRDVPDTLCHERHGGILRTEGVVDALSALRPDETWVDKHIRGGVWAVIEGPDDFAADSLGAYSGIAGSILGIEVGKRSKHLLVTRPSHWLGHELPYGVARMMIYGQTAGAPVGHHADVVAGAKRDLAPGEKLDGEGGYCVSGFTERAWLAREEGLVPIALTDGATVVRPVPAGGFVTYDDVELPETKLLELRRRLEEAVPAS